MAETTADREEQVEVYRCTLELEVNRVIDGLLAPAGIDCYVHNRTTHALPAPSAETGAYFIAVPAPQAAEARRVLARARADGELDEQSGELIGT